MLADLAGWLPAGDGSLVGGIVKEALTYVGLLEMPLGSNRSPFIDYMMDHVGSPRGESWCAAFLTRCFAVAGAKTPPSSAGACETWHQWALTQGVFAKAQGPKPGDGILFDFEGTGKADHCGIVVRTDPALLTVEGNTTTILNDKEGIGVFLKYRPNLTGVVGFIVPTAK